MYAPHYYTRRKSGGEVLQEKKHILIIDDSVTSLKHAQEMLKDDYRLALSKSGKQALEFLKDNIPDLILLDINMPQMNGYEILDRLKEDPSTAGIPVVFLTGDGTNESELKGFQKGAMDFITKPFVPEIVKSRIDRIIELDEMRKKLEGQVKMQTSQLESIRLKALKDGLTGLHNRNGLKQLVDAYVEENGSGAFVMIDLDNFKQINDNFGHIVGDEVLIKVAGIISDVIGEANYAGRIGGDEFVVFLCTALKRDDARTLAQELLSTLKKKFFNSYLGDISMSMGIAMAGEDGDDFETLYSKADKSLYYVKQNGKSGYHFYSARNVEGEEVNLRSIEVDVAHLTNVIKEQTPVKGAYIVEYEAFKRIYRFLERIVGRTKSNIQMVLFTIKDNGQRNDPDATSHAMDQLGEVISYSLRRGDVGTRYNACQYVVILMGTDRETGIIVATRIIDRYLKRVNNPDIEISFDYRNIEPNEGGGPFARNTQEQR